MRHRYPFDALHWLRHQRVDRQAVVVSESAARTAQAAQDEARASAERARVERGIADVAQAEHARLNEGVARAGELQAMHDWRRAADAELRLTAEREQHAAALHRGEVEAEGRARVELGAVSNEAKIIDQHRSDFRTERAAALERSEEEAAAEQWTASHYPARRS